MQTRIQISIIIALGFLIWMAGMVRVFGPKPNDERIAMAKLCAAYFQYADDTHKVITTFDKTCYR